jgi:exosortase A
MSANLLPGNPMVPEATSTIAARWRVTLVACVAVFAGLLAVFWPTVQGMVHIWYNFETYTHGFLILPISLWLVWRKRAHLAAFTPQPAPFFLLLVGGGLLVWGLARLTGVLVAEQAAFVGIVIGAIASLLGWQVARFLAFPLLFLFFAVPMGEDLIPPMMEFTATFTVEALRLTGIPVYREGLWFSLPSGNWSVVEACSGVRYLIASVTLGVMYAYITYHTLWKRLLFIAMSAIVPIIANGLRAYMIVMIGHLSEMEYATGVDHLLYGWVFFGVVMFILFWIGSIWQEHEPPPRFVPPPRTLSSAAVGLRVAVIAGLVVAASAGTLAAVQQAEAVQIEMAGPLAAPAGGDGWERLGAPTLWTPEHQPTPHTIAARYAQDDLEVQLFVVLFPQQRQGSEAINQANRIAVELVRRIGLGADEVVMGQAQVKVNRYRAIVADEAGTHEHLVWQWYRVAGHSLTNRYAGKAHEALARLYPGRTDGAWIAVTTPADSLDQQAAEQALADFVQRMAPRIDAAIDSALGVVQD